MDEFDDTPQDEIIDQADIQEEFDDNDDMAPMSDDDDEQEPLERPVLEIVDNSVQGFFEHKEPVYTVALNQRVCVSGGGNDKSFLWSIDTGEKLFDLGVHTDSCSAVGYSRDGKFVCSGGLDGQLFVFNADGTQILTLQGPNEVSWVDWHPRGPVLLAGGEDGSIWMWQIPSGQCMQVFTGHADAVTCGQFTPDGKAIVSAGADSAVIVWDPKTGQALYRWDKNDQRFHQEGVNSIGISKDGSILVSGGSDGTLCVLQLQNGRFLNALEAHQESIESIAFSLDANWCSTSSVDGQIVIWDMTTMTQRQILRHDDAITKVKWLPGYRLASSSMDSTLRLWDARTGALLQTFEGHQAGILDFDANQEGSVFVTAADDGNCLVFAYNPFQSQ
ncbi:quinon protein alcohol dehydrogenase-like superfamily [Gorgonomyces haynaldii]|nr:quinon protein alcohol dehydrogenase-like superfamily [Gorgonomyces haynaldii]